MVKRGLNPDRLVAIAYEYVAQHGIDALTMRRLAAAADVTPGALYKHFRSKDDLRRMMAAAIFARVDLSDVDTAQPSAEQVAICCERLRDAMLSYRDGGRVLAGSYGPSPAALRLSGTLLTLLDAITLEPFDAGDIAIALRSYTTGFVIEEQAYIQLDADGEWDALVATITDHEHARVNENSDVIAIMTGDRDQRFRAGLTTILAGTVR